MYNKCHKITIPLNVNQNTKKTGQEEPELAMIVGIPLIVIVTMYVMF